ncbi:MAG: sugar-specific transcriptional regulator TrmB [Candidatus Woesearchaeota archaeon]|jgi:sugar-specific transcriptional regulator TrmB
MNYIALQEAGLTSGEIKVYLALLELGISTTGPIVEKSKVARSIMYQILEKLIEKGIVSYITKEKTKYFTASDPSRLLDYIDDREKKLQKNKEIVKKLLPQLELLQKRVSQKSAAIFEGHKGMITVHDHTYNRLVRGEEYFYLGIPAEQPTHLHAAWHRDHKRRVKAGIRCKLLFNAQTSDEVLLSRNKYKNCDARRMPKGVDTPAWFMGYKDVAVIGFPSTNPVTIEIVHQEIADSFRAYFESFWKKARPVK